MNRRYFFKFTGLSAFAALVAPLFAKGGYEEKIEPNDDWALYDEDIPSELGEYEVAGFCSTSPCSEDVFESYTKKKCKKTARRKRK